MKTLILEGIATSGKSKITGYLTKSLKDEVAVDLATEEQTHLPIMAQTSELNNFFSRL